MELPHTVQVVGFAWYRLEDYDHIKAVMADRHLLPANYSIWRLKAEQGENQARRSGKRVVRAYIDPNTFPDWCRERGLQVNAEARVHFANLVAKKAHQDLSGPAGGCS